MSWCLRVCVYMRIVVGCRVYIPPKLIKGLVQTLLAMPSPEPLVVCRVPMWRAVLWCVGL